MKSLLKSTVAVSALLLAACSGADNNGDAGTDNAEVATAAKPELGTWGVDMTAVKSSVKPGDNFFEYASGSWLDTFEIPADKSSYGAFTVLGDRSRDRAKAIIDDLASGSFEQGTVEQKIGDYYNSYMDTDTINARGIDPIRPLLADIAAASSHDDILVLFGRSAKDNLASPITFGLGIDRQNPDRYQFNMGIGGMSLPDRDYYLEDTDKFKETREAYVKHVAQMLSFAEIDDAEAKAEAILAIETKLAEKQWPRSERRNRDKTLNPADYADFKTQYPGLDWDAFFAARDMGGIERLNVSFPDAVAALPELIKGISVDDWKAYLAYNTISNHAALLTEEIDTANFDFFGKTLNGIPQQRERWERATARVGALNALGEAIGQVYVKRYFPESSKQQMVTLVENLGTALGQRIDGLEWMGDDTKVQAQKKLSTFNPKIGYPDKWRDVSAIEIVKGDLFANAKAVAAFNHQRSVDRLTSKTDKDEWFMSPHQVNAYYNPQFNEIVFPAAILQAPFFDPAADLAVNYGGIGAVIGHEMGHGFDDQGSKSDEKGVQRNWWTEEDRAAFEERTTMLGAQYDGYEAVPGHFVDGNFTMGENIGDVGGLSMAYHAYKLALGGKEAPIIDGLTGDQRFFLAWAQVWKRKYRDAVLINRLKSDPHSPAEFRVNGVVRNMDEWYEAFDVKEGDALYLAPEDRVSIW